MMQISALYGISDRSDEVIKIPLEIFIWELINKYRLQITYFSH